MRVPAMPVDRSFAMKGFGTVVTGTLASGTIKENDELELLPYGRDVRVRTLQTHGRQVASAQAGQRTAVNIAGVDHHKVRRGMVLAERGVLKAAGSIDAEVDVLAAAARPVRSRQRVRFHVGSAEVLARVTVLNDNGEIAPGSRGFAQIRFESPTVALNGDRFVLRSYSPSVTIGGGVVLEPDAARHRRKSFNEVSNVLFDLTCAINDPKATMETLVIASGNEGLRIRDIRSKTGWTTAVLNGAVSRSRAVAVAGDILVSRNIIDSLRTLSLAKIQNFHSNEPLSNGITREALHDQVGTKIPDEVMALILAELSADGKISIDADAISLAGHKIQLSQEEQAAQNHLLNTYRLAGVAPPKTDEVVLDAANISRLAAENVRRVLKTLVADGALIKVTDEFYFAAATIDALKNSLSTLAETQADRMIDVPRFKELAGVSRRYAIPLLEYFDREKVTVRRGDKRYIL